MLMGQKYKELNKGKQAKTKKKKEAEYSVFKAEKVISEHQKRNKEIEKDLFE